MSTRSRRASNASDTSQEAAQAVDGAALGAQLAALSAAVKEIVLRSRLGTLARVWRGVGVCEAMACRAVGRRASVWI